MTKTRATITVEQSWRILSSFDFSSSFFVRSPLSLLVFVLLIGPPPFFLYFSPSALYLQGMHWCFTETWISQIDRYLPRAVIFMRIGFETPCFGWMGTPTVLPLSDCWKWFSSRVNGLFLRRGTRTRTEQLVVEVVCTVLCLVVFCTVAWSQGASSVFRRKKTKNGNDKRHRFLLEVAISPFGPPSFDTF